MMKKLLLAFLFSSAAFAQVNIQGTGVQIGGSTGGSGSYVPITGGVTMTGYFNLFGNPVSALQPTTKQYVDAAINTSVLKSFFTGTGTMCLLDNLTFGACGGGGGAPTAPQISTATGIVYAQGSTFATQFAVPNTYVIGGATGPTDTNCAPPATGGMGDTIAVAGTYYSRCVQGHFVSEVTQGDFYKLRAPITTSAGFIGGFTHGHVSEAYDAGPGVNASNNWRIFQLNYDYFQSLSAGIKQRAVRGCWVTGLGDNACGTYDYMGVVDGTASAYNDEGTEPYVLEYNALGSYHGTANAAYAATTSAIFLTQTADCGQHPVKQPTTCAGSSRILLRNSSQFPVTVTAITSPNYATNTYGTMTTSTDLTARIPQGSVTIAAAIPITTTFPTGSTITETVATATGTMKTGSNNPGCLLSYDAAESVLYSITGTTATISRQNFSHQGNSTLFDGECTWFDPTPDSTTMGSKVAFLAIPTAANTITWATWVEGFLKGSWLGTAGFQAGTTGRNVGALYQGVRVLSLANPAQTAASEAGSDGYMYVEPRTWAITSGEAFEEALYPSSKLLLTTKYCGVIQPGNFNSTTACNYDIVNGPIGDVTTIRLDNRISDTNGGTGYLPIINNLRHVTTTAAGTLGRYSVLDALDVTPQNAALSISSTAGCSHSWNFFVDASSGASSLYNCADAGGPSVTHEFSGGVSFASNTQVNVKGGMNFALFAPPLTITTLSGNNKISAQNGGSNADLFLGTDAGPGGPVTASDGGWWIGALHATTSSQAGIAAAGYHAPYQSGTAAYSGTAGSIILSYIFTTLLPNGAETTYYPNAVNVFGTSTLGGGNTVTITYPNPAEAGYPSGVVIRAYRSVFGSGAWVLAGTSSTSGGTSTDNGAGTSVSGLPTFLGNSDAQAARFIAQAGGGLYGVANAYPGTATTANFDNCAAATWCVGNGTKGDFTGTIKTGALLVGGTAVVPGSQTFAATIQPGLFSTLTMLGPVFQLGTAGAAKTGTMRIEGTIACTTAIEVELMDLGTSATTSYSGASGSVYGITGGTSDGVYSFTGNVNMVAGHYYGYAFTGGTCTTYPTVDLMTQIQ